MTEVDDRGIPISEGDTQRAMLARHPELAAILTAEGLSATGDAVFWVGLLVWLLGQPNGTSLIALAAVARLGPRVVLGAGGGVLADRYDRRILLVGLDIARAALMVLLTVLVQSETDAAAVLLVVTLAYVLATPYRPAMTAAIPLVAGERDAAAGNALDGVIRQIATFLGPLLGTAVLWLGSPSWAFAVNAVTFLLSALLLVRVSGLAGPPPAVRIRPQGHQTGHWWDSMGEGVRAMTHQPGIPLMTWLVFVFSVARGFELVLLVLVAQDQLGLGAEGVGVLSAAIGVGALSVVPLVRPVAESDRPSLLMFASLLLTAIPLALLAIISSPVFACAVLIAVGVGVVVFEVLSITLVQRLSRIDLLGRVFGIENTAVNGGKLAGCVLAPLLVTAISLEGALLAAALIVAVSALAAVPRFRTVARTTIARRHELEPLLQVLRPLPLFDGASAAALERVAATMHPVTVTTGTDVVRQGADPDDLYLIRAGTLDVVKNGVLMATLGAENWFGEIGLLRRTPRTATVRAATDADLWVIPGQDFLAAINESALMPTALLEELTVRLAQLDEVDDAGS